MKWRVETTAEFDSWLAGAKPSAQERTVAAVQMLRELGPAAGRPLVDSVKGSRHSNMKELRTGTIRVLFAFDPKRTAILLVAGDKRGQWHKWYRRAMPKADRLFDRHLRDLRSEGSSGNG